MYVDVCTDAPRAMNLTAIIGCPGIEDLREKREAINREILKDEEEKAKIQKVCNSGLVHIAAALDAHLCSGVEQVD